MSAFSDLIPNRGEFVYQYVARVGSVDKAWRTWNDFSVDYISRANFRDFNSLKTRRNVAKFF